MFGVLLTLGYGPSLSRQIVPINLAGICASSWALVNELIDLADGFPVFFVIGGGEIEVDAAEGAVGFGLAEDDGDLFVEGDAVTEIGAAILVGFDGFFHQGNEGSLAFLGGLIEADDILLESLEGFSNFRLE
jgi:hypothetical protein